MIRINLLQDVTAKVAQAPQQTKIQTAIAQVANFSDILVKIGIAFIPLVLTLFYEAYEVGQKKESLEKLSQKVTAVKGQTSGLGKEIDAVKRFQEEKSKLDQQVDTIRKLSRERLQNVKAMSALQDIIPLKAWITDLRLEREKVSLNGFAIDGIVVSEFVKSLDESIYFKEVTFTIAEATTSEGNVKSFSIKCSLENM